MKTKTILKRALTLLLTLLMLLSTTTIGISAAKVELAETGYDLKCVFIYDNSKTQWSSVQLLVGHSTWSQGYMMTKIANTNLWYYNMSSTWGGATHIAVFNASSTWGGEGNSVSHRVSYMDKNSAAKALSGNMTSGIQLLTSPSSATSSTDNFALTTSYVSAYSGLNTTQTATVQSAPAGSTSYTNNSAAGTTTISTYKMSSSTASTTSTGTTSASAARTATVTMEATANAGYEFVGWYNSSGTQQTTSTTLTYTCSGSAATYYARFQEKVTDVTATFIDYYGAKIDEVTVQSGNIPTAPTAPTVTGHTFTGWSDGTTTYTSDNLPAITANTTFTAQYTINSYSVTATANPTAGGTASASASTVNHGGSVTLTANPYSANGYAFTGWEIGGSYTVTSGSLTSTSVTLTVTGDIDATATFEQIPTYTVKGQVGLSGAGTVSPVNQEVAEGNSIVLTAVPNTGYVFTGWSISGTYTVVSGTISSASFEIIPTADVTATANFRANKGTVTFAAGNGGTVTNSGANTVTHPNSAASTATANTGYTFNKWTVTGGTLNTDYTMSTNGSQITITPIKDGAALTATASFTINSYKVVFEDYDGTVIDTQTVTYGSGATAPADPERKGYTFKGWDKTFSNITADTTVTATYTADTYTVGVTAGTGGTATTSATSVTYPNTVTLTATPSSADYIFTKWTINGAYEVVSGSETSATFVIRPEADIVAQANFALGQYLTVHSFSSSGYDNLYLWEMQGTAENYPNGEWPGTAQPNTNTFNGVTWKTSDQMELTYGYSTEVGAILNDGGLTIPSGTGNLIMFNNTLGWSNVYLYTSSNNLWNGDNGCTTNGATRTDMKKIEGTNYWYAYVSSTASILFMKDKQDGYGNIWQTSAAYRTDFSSSNPMYNPPSDSNQTTNSTTYYSDGSWGAVPSGTQQSEDIDLTTTLYNNGVWKGVSEVWITEDGVVTLRRDLLDLVTEMTPEYNGGTNVMDYTATSWTAFVNAYKNAYSISGAAASTQTQIDDAETALQEAYEALELQAYYNVTVDQNLAGTIVVGNTTINTTTGTAKVTQGSTATVTITAPAGYYIQSVTGAISASNVTSYTGTITVDGDKNITVTYAKNPTVTVNQTGGTVTVNGATSPVEVTYGNKAEIVVKAPELNYIAVITVNGTPVYTNTTESETTCTYTIDSVTADTTVTVTYAPRTTYKVEVLPYPEAGGSLSYNGEKIPAEGKTIEVLAGATVTITATPNSGYGVSYWVVDNATGTRELTYTFSNISANHTIDVEWEELETIDVTVSAKPGSAGTATANGTSSVTLLQYDPVKLVATVKDQCYEFVNWTIEGSYYSADDTTRNDATFNIVATGNITATANFTQVYRRIYLDNDANWSQPYIYTWGSSMSTTAWPGDKMTYDSTTGYWVGYIPMDATNIQFNPGDSSNQVEFGDVSKNLYNNSSKTSDTYVEKGYYLQGKWNGKTYSGYDLQKFEDNGDGTYNLTITVTSTTDGYIYVNPTNENSHFWNAKTANATGNPQTLQATGAYQENPNYVKVEIDTDNFTKAYDVTFTFNPTTGAFSWTKAENVPTITVNGTDGTLKNQADVNMDTPNDRIGDTYFDEDTVNRTTEHTNYQEAQVVANTPVTFYTQVNGNGSGGYDYYVAGWVINGTEFVSATAMGNGLYSGSYVFTEDNTSVVPIYFHTQEWLTANGVETVTVYAVADKDITNWDKYMAAYTWYKVGGATEYEQFGGFPGQLMIPVAGLDGVYYTIIETSTGDKTQISGVTFSNYASTEKQNVDPVTDYSNIQTYDYYEFIALLEDGKQNITFVIKDTNDTYNSNRVSANTNVTLSNFDFVQYTDYSGLKTDIFGNNIESIDSTLSDSNAVYIIQAGDKNVSDGTLDGQWYVENYIYDSTGKYLGKCYSYELHDEDSDLWTGILAGYENQRAYFSYEHVNGARYDGEWYGDSDLTVTINLAVNVALMGEDGKYTIDTTDPVNEADYGTGYINVTYQNVDVTRGTVVTLTAMPKTGYKFVGWYSHDGILFSTNTTYSVTAAIGTTYTAVFEELAEGSFYVNHYIYQGVGTAGYIPPAHGGNAVLYVGIENKTQGTKTTLLQSSSASIEATEGDKLIITIATDATGADKFYAWYTDAVDKYGLTTFEEVGVDSVDNLYNNGGTVVGRSDMVYFQFEYTVSDIFSMNLYSDLMPVSVNVTLVYQYTDRNDNIKSYYVPYTLTAQEIEGFAGNGNTPYTPAYISSTDGSWVNTVLVNAPYVEDYYKDTTWIINSAMYDTMTFLLWATQPYTMYTVTTQINDQVIVSQVPYNTVLDIDARNYIEDASIDGFWYNDVNSNGSYDKAVDIILTYGPQYGYRVTQDMSINYESVDDYDFSVSLDAPVYGREQTTDTAGNPTSDKILVDYVINILTPYFYGQDNDFTPIYDDKEVTDNWNGQHVTIESLKAAGYKIEYGVITEQVGSFLPGSEYYPTYADAETAAKDKGYGTATDASTLIGVVDNYTKPAMVDGKYYTVFDATGFDITNKNRVLFTISFNNTETNQKRFCNVYSYVTVTYNGTTTTYISNVQTLNIYETAVKDAVVNDNTTFA